MAERRMFAKTIIDSDAFLDLPATTQNLYFHLSMRADDEGFINKPKAVMRIIGSSQTDIEMLIAKKFVIPFESGVVVIKHWKIHNYIRKDRMVETKYKEEKAMLSLDENDSYTICQPNDNQMTTNGQPNDNQVTTKCQPNVSIGKDRIGEDRIGKDISIDIVEIVTYLNELCGTNYKSNGKKIRSLISARMNEGFTVEDFKTVIWKKSREWKDDPNMCQYLRPITLFGTKFESYLNQQTVMTKEEKRRSELQEWLNE